MRRTSRPVADIVVLMLCVLAGGCAARSAPIPGLPAPGRAMVSQPSADDIQQEFQPDRPTVANAAHTVPVALLQLEAGGRWSHVAAGQQAAGTPLSLRAGIRDWLEARVESSGVGYQQDAAGSSIGWNGLQLGAKLRLAPALAILPAVNLPIGAKAGTDYGVTLITGTDFAGPNHVDVNYGLASVGTGSDRFLQQWATVSASRQVTEHLSPYAEVYWYSRQDPGGGRLVSSDVGFTYTFNARFAVDGGADVGLSDAAPRVTVFTGLSVVVGEIHGHHGVYGRLREAAERRLARER